MPFWCYMHMLLFGKKRGHLTTRGSPVKYGDQILRLLEAVPLPAKVSVSHCKGHQKGNREVAQGDQKADQASKRAALQNNDLIGVATLFHRLICQKLLHILKVRLLKLRVKAFKKIIWDGSKRRGSFFCLGTSSGSWLTPYMPPLI